MSTNLNRVIGIAGAVAIVAAALWAFKVNDAQDGAYYAHIAPPAKDALVQNIDLSRITRFRYVDDHTLEVADETGKNFKMELTEDCPGLKGAQSFSLVTESYQNFDRFTAIGVNGRICTFKDFAPLPSGALAAPTAK